jgi:hypothetical protein
MVQRASHCAKLQSSMPVETPNLVGNVRDFTVQPETISDNEIRNHSVNPTRTA